MATVEDEAPATPAAEFDAFAAEYDAALAAGISVSGEDKTYFARGRVKYLAHRLPDAGVAPCRVLDFGCGTGSSIPYLAEYLQPRSIVGVDVSHESLARAEHLHGGPRVDFRLCSEFQPTEQFDVAFCNGVFHHIPLAERSAAVAYIYQALRPGGVFAFWENNPWNPGTRYVMSKIPFDRDAITLTPPEAKRLLAGGGFQPLRTDFLFIFPRFLAALRPLEACVRRLPLGAQYQVLCKKPLAADAR